MSDLSAADALKMFEAAELGEIPQEEPKTESKAEEPKAEEPKAEDAPKDQPKEEEREPQGIATKDGKHVIPYSVLQSERTRAAQAEKELQETRARLAELQAAATAPKDAAKTGDAATPETSTEEADRLAQLAEDFPTVAEELKANRALIKALEAKFGSLEEKDKQAEAQRADQVAMTVQEAIDSLPKMAHIQAANPEAFELAKQFDTALRARPDWADKPMAERFAKVVDLVEASMGEIAIPGQSKPSEDPAALKKAAAEKLATAEKAVPTSLSQFPAGAPAAADEAAAVEQMSTTQLAAKMARMTPDQIDAYFANL